MAAVIEPMAGELLTAEGRDFLRIVAQLAGRAGVRSRTTPVLVAGTALAGELDLLGAACREFLPEPLALERIASVISFLTVVLADRAARLSRLDGAAVLLDHTAFTANLVEMVTAALRAPVPA